MNLGNLGFLGSTLQGVRQEDVNSVRNALSSLCLGGCAIDSAGSLDGRTCVGDCQPHASPCAPNLVLPLVQVVLWPEAMGYDRWRELERERETLTDIERERIGVVQHESRVAKKITRALFHASSFGLSV